MKNNELREKIYDNVREELLRMGLISSSLKGHTVAINNIVDVVLKYQREAYKEEAIGCDTHCKEARNSLKAELVKELEERKQNCGCYNCGIEEAIEIIKKQ